jgi:RNA polymerase primary sigma factor
MRQLKISKQFTDFDSLSLKRYLQDISKLKLLSSEKEEMLCRRIREGDKAAMNSLIKANLRFVVSVSKQYQNRGLDLSDLINEGNLGLVKAAERFDETRGFKFITYAVWWIRQSIHQAIHEKSRIVRLPVNQISTKEKISNIFNKFEQEFQREPTINELAELAGISPKEVENSLNLSGSGVSLDAASNNPEWKELHDYTDSEEYSGPDSDLIRSSLKLEIERSFSILTKREADILRSFYGLNGSVQLSMDEIADKHGLSVERIRQIMQEAKEKLKQQEHCNRLLRQYL